jgi:hypothetical protein
MLEHDKPWNPLTRDEVADLFMNATFPWWIAGGIALELALGNTIRKHADIDVLILRRDHAIVRELLNNWDCWAADPPGRLRPWPAGTVLGHGVHDVWCRQTADDDWRLQLMLDESDGEDWVSRRDSRIRAQIDEIGCETATGIPYLAPHVQLFYKAKNLRKKDEVDFAAVIGSGISLNTVWLRDAIVQVYGVHHPWLPRLVE